MRIGTAVGREGAGAVLRDAEDEGFVRILGVLDVLGEARRPPPRWSWSCACGIDGAWCGSLDLGEVVLAAFLDRHQLCLVRLASEDNLAMPLRE